MAQDARWETLPAATIGIVLLGACGALGMAHSTDQEVWADTLSIVQDTEGSG